MGWITHTKKHNTTQNKVSQPEDQVNSNMSVVYTRRSRLIKPPKTPNFMYTCALCCLSGLYAVLLVLFWVLCLICLDCLSILCSCIYTYVYVVPCTNLRIELVAELNIIGRKVWVQETIHLSFWFSTKKFSNHGNCTTWVYSYQNPLICEKHSKVTVLRMQIVSINRCTYWSVPAVL